MLAHIVKIGNSHGVRLPKPLLQQAGLEGVIDLQVEGNMIVLRPAPSPARAGWPEAFRRMAQRGDDALLDADADAVASSAWDEEEWVW